MRHANASDQRGSGPQGGALYASIAQIIVEKIINLLLPACILNAKKYNKFKQNNKLLVLASELLIKQSTPGCCYPPMQCLSNVIGLKLMRKLFLRSTFVSICAGLALQAQALVVLPPECQLSPVSEFCLPGEEPSPAPLGELVGTAIFQKLIHANPENTAELLSSNFVENWTQAWVNFPVPQLIEEQILALNPSDFEAWLDWLCTSLHPNGEPAWQTDFQQVPPLLIESSTLTNPSAVPLPASIWLFASAVLGLSIGGKRRTE